MQCLIWVWTAFVYKETLGGSVVVCLTRDLEDAVSCLTGGSAEPGTCKLDIKRREPGILFINLPLGSLFKQAIMT